MLEWISRQHRDARRQAQQEAELKKSRAEKVQRFQASPKPENRRYTVLTINGKKLRVPKEQITIEAVSPITMTTQVG